ncbi:S8 family serine peptidase [Nocardiopsis sediminis]|uniref:S8 family serine peptidase n=1 Tax=Nocardiopsis sediminis TaxID=1778267 RepID=A0ABV8FI60_9ACTN
MTVRKWTRAALLAARCRPAGRVAVAAACAVLAAAPATPALAEPAPDTSAGAEPAPGASADAEADAEPLPAIGVAPDGECVATSSTVVEEEPWTTPLLDLPRAWELTEGAGATVAILSSGIDAETAAVSRALAGSGSADCQGYGTFLAGLVAARPQRGSGLTGVAPAARVIDVPVMNDAGQATAGAIASGIDTAVSEGAGIVLVGAAVAESSRGLNAAVSAAAEADALVVAPATVTIDNTSVPAAPGSHPSAVSVTAVGVEGAPVAASPALDADGEAARVDLTAPGDLVVSVGPGGDGHFVGSGDVVAAGFVAGAAALLRSYEPELPAPAVRERLLATAYPSPYGPGDSMRGSGRVDPVGALTAAPGGADRDAALGSAFVPDPGPGDVFLPSTMAVVGVATALILTTVALGVLIPRGRKRAWRAARPGERRAADPEPQRPS